MTRVTFHLAGKDRRWILVNGQKVGILEPSGDHYAIRAAAATLQLGRLGSLDEAKAAATKYWSKEAHHG